MDLPVEIGIFNAKGRALTYDRNEIIVRGGDTPSGIYTIESGCVLVSQLSHDGHETIFAVLGPTDMFPLSWAITGDTRDVFFTALAETQVRRISIDDFNTALRGDVGFNHHVLTIMARNLTILTNELIIRDNHLAVHKVIYRLISFAQRFGEPHAHGLKLTLRLTHDIIARSVNVSRETVSRSFHELGEKRLVRVKHGFIVIPSLSNLVNELGEEPELLL